MSVCVCLCAGLRKRASLVRARRRSSPVASAGWTKTDAGGSCLIGLLCPVSAAAAERRERTNEGGAPSSAKWGAKRAALRGQHAATATLSEEGERQSSIVATTGLLFRLRLAPARSLRQLSTAVDRDRVALLVEHNRRLAPDSLDEATQDAELQLAWIKRAAAAATGDREERTVDRMIRELVHLEKPLAYVLGTQPFYPLPVELLVRPPTLIPRPETEHWLNLLVDRLRPGPRRILDIGTGSGCIALALTYALTSQSRSDRSRSSEVRTVAVDQSEAALSLAGENAHRCGLATSPSRHTRRDQHQQGSLPPAGLVSFVQSDLFAPDFASTVLSALPGPSSSSASSSASPFSRREPQQRRRRFDLVVSNPPYIPLREYETLDRSVREWEDRRALVGEPTPRSDVPSTSGAHPEATGAESTGDDDGLAFYRRIVSLLETLLEPPPPSSPPVRARHRNHNNSSPTRQPLPQDRAPASALSSPCVAFEVGRGQARAVERMLLAWRPTSPDSRPTGLAPSSSLPTSTVRAGVQGNRNGDGQGTTDRAAGDTVSATNSRPGWRLQTEVVVDPWGVERAVFAWWTTSANQAAP